MKRQITEFIAVSSTNTPATQDLTLKDLDLRDRNKGWLGCVYHFVIRRGGDVEKGRDYENHAMGFGARFNALTVSICLVGGQGEPPFTVQQDNSLKDLVMELRQEYPEAVLRFHAEFPQNQKGVYEQSLLQRD